MFLRQSTIVCQTIRGGELISNFRTFSSEAQNTFFWSIDRYRKVTVKCEIRILFKEIFINILGMIAKYFFDLFYTFVNFDLGPKCVGWGSFFFEI